MCRKMISYLIGSFLFCQLLAGCGGENYTYTPDNEIKPGPGILSGKDGTFTILGSSTFEEAKTKEMNDSTNKEPNNN